MADDTDVAARLSQAIERRATLMQEMQAHAAGIAQVRATLGNPFFYSPRPEGDPQSESKFTGYNSNEPAFQLFRALWDVSKEIEVLRGQLPRTKPDAD